MRPLSLSLSALSALAIGVVACSSILGVEDVEKRPNTTNDGGRPGGEDPGEVPPDGLPDDPDGEAPTKQYGELALGFGHGCARKTDSTVMCWGENGAGQLGDGIPFNQERPSEVATPQAVPGIDDATSIASGQGSSHTCVIRKTGKVSCWGYNFFGQLGNDATERSSSPVDAVGLTDATRLAMGISFSCAVREGKTVMCWGIGDKGQLAQGDADLDAHHVPTAVPGLTAVETMTCGQTHACAVVTGGTVKCWGDNEKGQLGLPGVDPVATPTAVGGLSKIVQLSAGAEHTCAREESGKVLCWGSNESGQLGQGTLNPITSATPLPVSGLTDAKAIYSGNDHTCAVRKSGVVSCWGAGADNQIGAPPSKDSFTAPAEVANLTGAIGVWANGNFSCAMVTDGKVSCWGSNTFGQLGTGNMDPAPTPRPLLNFP